MKKMILNSLTCLSLLAMSIPALAQQDGHRRGRRGPPPQAMDACKSKASGDACSFESPRRGTVQGTCWAPSQDRPLACRPTNRPKR
jgi:hypothetical protein